jgi:hypothetical protein
MWADLSICCAPSPSSTAYRFYPSTHPHPLNHFMPPSPRTHTTPTAPNYQPTLYLPLKDHPVLSASAWHGMVQSLGRRGFLSNSCVVLPAASNLMAV